VFTTFFYTQLRKPPAASDLVLPERSVSVSNLSLSPFEPPPVEHEGNGEANGEEMQVED
jgi:hypothetical protein